MNALLLNLYIIVQLILLVLIGMAALYMFIFSFAGLFYRQLPYYQAPAYRKIAVLIPGYKEDDVILEVAEEALKQTYPSHEYDVVIIADSFQPETLKKLKMLPLIVVEVSFDKSTKSKALNKAMAELSETYEIAVVLDADNIMEGDFLMKVNAAFGNDFMAVQGHRKAKNLDTSLAVLDAVSEEINNHIFRKGHRALGLSSAIIGSGMAFDYHFFKKLMSGVTAIGGFDKEIELKLLKDRHVIEYLHDAVVYDEKVQKAEVFSNQRRRWLSAQLHYFRQDFLNSLVHLFTKGNIDYFDKAMQFIQPPRILLLGSVLVFGFACMIMNYALGLDPWYTGMWGILSAMTVLAFLFAVPLSFYTTQTLKAIASLPRGMMLMLGSLLKIRGANRTFIHTKHSSIKTQIK